MTAIPSLSTAAMALVSLLRREVAKARSEFRVSNVRTQRELIMAHTVRERPLAMPGLFVAVVALALGAVGLYGVLDYSVLQRRREIGICLAIGAPARNVVTRVAARTLSMVLAGAVIGAVLGLSSERYIRSLLFDVEAANLTMLAVPLLILAVVILVAAIPPSLRAVRTDHVHMLRGE